MLHGIFRESLIRTNDAAWRTLAHWAKRSPSVAAKPELEHCAMPELRPPETTELLCAIIAALILY